MIEAVKTYLKTKLNEEQYNAAIDIEHSSLILAWAGSGKTRTLTYKIAYLICAHNIQAHRILAVTFTNKAANEMKERLVELWKDFSWLADTWTTQDVNVWEKTKHSFNSFIEQLSWDIPNSHKSRQINEKDLKRVGTFHGVFLKILKEDIEILGLWYKKNFSIYDTNETQNLIKAIIKNKKREEDIKPAEAKALISRFKNKWWFPRQALESSISDYDEKIGEIYDLYTKELKKVNALDFDDLLLITYELLKSHKEICEKRQNSFDYILVDEAQDTNQIQFDLIKMLSKKSNNVTLIGDDYQSIYGRRGAVMENFLNVKKYRPDMNIHKLQINYRSRPHIVNASSHIIKKNSEQYEKNLQAHRKGEDHIIILSHGDEIQEAHHIIGMIKKLKEQKNTKRWDMAILYRTNSQSQVFEHSLVTGSIPYKVWWGFKFFERKEIKDIVAYLKFMRNMQDNLSLKRIINTPSRKIGKTTIDAIEDYANKEHTTMYEVITHIQKENYTIAANTKNKLQQFAKTITFRSKGFPNMTPAELITKIIIDIGYKEYLIKEEADTQAAEEKYDNIWQLINMASKITETGEEWLDKLLDEISLMTDIIEEWTNDIDAVKLMTIHSSKGLEFPAVFIVGCEENIFPLSRSVLDSKQLEEERRLMYVAITRAKDHLFISHTASRRQRGNTNYNPPSRFIQELPSELTKHYDLMTQTTGYNSKTTRNKISSGDKVQHKLFGKWEAIEIRNSTGIIKFDNPKYWLRKIELKLLEKI